MKDGAATSSLSFPLVLDVSPAPAFFWSFATCHAVFFLLFLVKLLRELEEKGEMMRVAYKNI